MMAKTVEERREYLRGLGQKRRANPEWKARERARRATPEWKAKERARCANPEYRAKLRARRANPEYNAKLRARRANPEYRAKVRERDNRRRKNLAANLYEGAKHRATLLNRNFDITIDDIKTAWPADNICPILHVPMERKTPFAPSLDRIDNSKGYAVGNIAVVSMMANRAKSDATPEMLYRMASFVARATKKPGAMPSFIEVEWV